MELKTKSPLLRFDPAETETLKSLSAALFVGARLWVASDELNSGEQNSVERLSTADGEVFENHKSFPLGELIRLPAAGTNADQEIDIEGMDFHDSHLWLVGSHSRKRKKVEPDDEGKDSKLIAKLSEPEVKSKGNRFILARIPLVTTDGEQELRSPAEVSTGSGQSLTASQLRGGPEGNDLSDAIRHADGEGDVHLRRFIDVPSKDNGLDVEGLAVAADKDSEKIVRVFLGLRGPVLRGWAVVLELAVDTSGPAALALTNFGPGGRAYRKHFLNLDGLGVRDLCFDGEDLLVLAGPTMNLDGPSAIYRWSDALSARDETLVRGERLVRVLEVPTGRGADHPEGIALVPGSGRPRQVLVVYDSPAAKRTEEGPGTVRVDVFELSPAG